MRIALIGLDDELLHYAATAAAAGNVVAQAYDVGKYLQPLMKAAPEVIVADDWESLLVGDVVDRVVVGTGPAEVSASETVIPADLRGEQLRRFVQEGIPVTVLPFACDLDQGYELEMYRREKNGEIATWHFDWNHAGHRWLHELLSEKTTSSLGRVSQVRWDVLLADRSRPVVLRRFINDVAHLRSSLGAIETVLATGAAGETHYDPFAPKRTLPPLDQLTVHLGTRSQRTAIWSVVPAHNNLRGRVTLVGPGGQAILRIGPAGEAWQGELQTGTEVETFDFPAIAFSPNPNPNPIPLPAWLDSCRDLEVVEALDRSLIRGRTVAVHADEATEADAFKGVMASGGCLVLTLVLFVLFAVVMVEGMQLSLRNWALWQAWPAALIGLILVFLGMQSLQVLVPKKSVDGEPKA